MRIVNHVLAVLLLLELLALALVSVALLTGALTVSAVRQVWPYAPVVGIARDVTALSHHLYRGQPVSLYLGAGAIVVGLLALWGLVRDLTPPPRRARTLVLRAPGGSTPGYTEVSYHDLDAVAVHSAEEIAGIERAQARVIPRRGGVTVRCRAVVSPFVDVAAIGPAVERAVAARLEHLTGLPVRAVRVRTVVQHDVRARRRVR